MATATEKAIEAVESLPNLIKLVKPPQVDRVIRIVPLEPRTLDLMLGPDAEEWAQIERLVFLFAPPEKKTLNPAPVGTRQEWTLMPEDVPVVELLTSPKDSHDSVLYNKTSREKKLHAKNLELAASQRAPKVVSTEPVPAQTLFPDNKQPELFPVKRGRGRPRKNANKEG